MTTQAAPTHRWVDEDRILSEVMPRMFQKGWPVLAELVQNCYRAQAQAVHIHYSHDPLSPWANPDDARPSEMNELRSIAIHDDGPGIPELDALREFLTVGASGFEDDWAEALPAGMGFYSLMAQAAHVTLTSGFGRVQIDTQRWFRDPLYRLGLFDEVVPDQTADGLKIMATGCVGLPSAQVIRYCRQRLGLYANTMLIKINDRPITNVQPKDFFLHCLDLGGTRVWWGPRSGVSLRTEFNITGTHNHDNRAFMSWFGHVVGKGCLYHGPKPGTGAGDVFIEVYGKAPELLPTPKLPDREEILGTDFGEEIDAFFASCHAQMAHHYRQYGVDFFRQHPHEALRWCRHDPEVFKLHSPVSVVRSVESVKLEEKDWEHNEWRIGTKPHVFAHDERVHLLFDQDAHYQTDEISVVLPDGSSLLDGDRVVTAALGEGNEGVFFRPLRAPTTEGLEDLYLTRGYSWKEAEALAGDRDNLLLPTDHRLVVDRAPERLPQGWWWLGRGAVWEVRWEDGRVARIPIHEDVLRQPNYLKSLDPGLVLGPAEEDGMGLEEILWERSGQIWMFQEDRTDEGNQREVFTRELEDFIDAIRGHVPLLTALDRGELDRWIKSPRDIVELRLDVIEDVHRVRKIHLVMQPGDPQHARRLAAEWESLGGKTHYDPETDLLTIDGLVC